MKKNHYKIIGIKAIFLSVFLLIVMSSIMGNHIGLNIGNNTDMNKGSDDENLAPMNAGSTYSPSISDTGELLNVSLMQTYKNDTDIAIDTDTADTTEIIMQTPQNTSFVSNYVNITFKNIKAYNQSKTVEDYAFGLNSSTIISYRQLAASFSVPGTCNISKFVFRLYVSQVDSTYGGVLDIYIRNATWNSTSKRFTVGPYSSSLHVASRNFSSPDPGSNWKTFYTDNITLDVSNTDNNTFFVILNTTSSNTQIDWYRTESLDPTKNSTWSYEYNAFTRKWTRLTETGGGNSSDFLFKVQVAPLTYVPDPSAEWFNLSVNGTTVEQFTSEGNGIYYSTQEFSGNSNYELIFTSSSNWPNASWTVDNRITEYKLTGLQNISYYYIPSPSAATYDWAVEYNVSEFEFGNFSEFKINFTIPDSWNSLKAYRDYSNDVSSNLSVYDLPGTSKIAQIKCPVPYGNNTWSINSTADNLGNNIQTLKDSNPVDIAYYQDILNITAYFTKNISGSVIMEIFAPNNSRVHGEEIKQVSDDDEVSFDLWDISTEVEDYGVYRIQVRWNDTEGQALFMEKSIPVVANTSVEFSPDMVKTNGSRVVTSDVFNVTVYYEDLLDNTQTQWVNGIDGATVRYKNGTDGQWYDAVVTNSTAGYYSIEINASRMNLGKNTLYITVSKQYYQNHSIYYEFIRNRKPSITSASITPDPAYTSDDLVANPSGWSDADGDPASYLYQWYKNGIAISGATSNTLDSSNFVKGDEIIVMITPFDGYEQGDPVNSSTLTIKNSPPWWNDFNANIAQTSANNMTDLSVTTTGTPSDLDSDTLTITYEWVREGDGVMIQNSTSTTLSHTLFWKGQTIHLYVHLFDGTDYNNTIIDGGSISISNEAPWWNDYNAAIAQSYANNMTDLSVNVSGTPSDLDDDALTITYEWVREGDGVTIQNSTSTTLSHTLFWNGQTIHLYVHLFDGTNYNNTIIDGGSITISNEAPWWDDLNITLAEASANNMTDLSVVINGSPLDLDNDSIIIIYEWIREGDGVTIQNSTSATLSHTLFWKGQTIHLYVHLFDGTDYNNTIIDCGTITISNEAPWWDDFSVIIAQTNADNMTDLSVNMTGEVFDMDDDEVIIIFQWVREDDGITLQNSTSATLSHELYWKGQTIHLYVYVWDGTVFNGSILDGGSILIVNSPPFFVNATDLQELAVWTQTQGFDNFSVDISSYIGDIDNDSIIWYITGINTSIITISGNNTSDLVIIFHEVEGMYGNTTFTLYIVDESGASANITISLTIIPAAAPSGGMSPAIMTLIGSVSGIIGVAMIYYFMKLRSKIKTA